MSKLHPIVALVTDETLTKLKPVVDDCAARLDVSFAGASDKSLLTMRLNGWDTSMMAWGLVLRAIAEADLDVKLDVPGDEAS